MNEQIKIDENNYFICFMFLVFTTSDQEKKCVRGPSFICSAETGRLAPHRHIKLHISSVQENGKE